jgi:HD superfamily phosphodiesterase
LTTIYDEIYKKAEPYWNTRQNDIHVPIVYDFAQQLLTYYPEADADVVLPAALLHDVGWKMVPAEKQPDAFGPKAKDKQAHRLHEVEGARIAGEILASLNYDPAKIKEIMAIIDGHDSRHKALSLNDKLVKDADKLWRFTPVAIEIDYQRFGVSLKFHLDWLEARFEGWMFTPEAKVMAHEMLGEAKSKAKTS